MPGSLVTEDRDAVFLDKEIHQITLKFRPEFKGGQPICIAVYQPTALGGRLVLIDAERDELGIIATLSPGQGARNTFLNPSEKLPWQIIRGMTDPQMLEDYRKNDERERMTILSIYQDRFPATLKLDANWGHVLLGTRYRLCYVCPTSLGHVADSARLYRLGLVYTFGRYFRSDPGLLNAAKAAGDIVLDVRLRNLLRDTGRFGPPDNYETHSAWEIAADLGEGIDISYDQCVFLISKLLLVHHHFMPQHPSGFSLISTLTKKAANTFTFHGLTTPRVSTSLANSPVLQLKAHFHSDLLGLVSACAWNRNTKNTHAMQITDAGKALISDAVPTALALLCGRVTHEKSERVAGPGHKNKGVFYIAPPTEIDHPTRRLPTFGYEDIKSDAMNPGAIARARAFIEALHPLGPAKVDESYAYSGRCGPVIPLDVGH